MTATAPFDIAGKRVLLAGATGVLGRTYAQALADAGARLALADLASTDVMGLADGLDALGIHMDIADEQSVVVGVAAAADALGGLDGAVCNAAATGELLMAEGDVFAPFETYPLETWRRTLDVNLTGTFLFTRECGREMRQSGGGSLITISSIYGIVGPDHRIYDNQPFKSFPGYSASKAGVLGLTRWLATWWGDTGVRVNCITPGGVYNDQAPAFAEAYADRTPMGRMADREELSGMVLYLLSDASSYCTGQNFIVDGGFTAW